MQRAAAIAAFALFLAVPLWAQRGGGHGGGFGGHAGGFSGGHMGGGHAGFSGGHFASGHSLSGMRGSSGISRGFAPRSFSRPTSSLRAFNSRGPFLHDRLGNDRLGNRGRFRDRFRDRDFFRNRGFFNNCWGWGCSLYGYPWWGYDPWLWNDDSSYDQSYEQNLADAAEMNRENLEEQRMLRQEEADGDQDAYAQRAPAPMAAPAPEPAAIQPATVLVFRDQHKQEVQNYAIVGHTLWDFAPQHTRKIALADLDIPATVKANDDRGVTFRVPAASDAPGAPPASMQGQPPAARSSSSV
jgi:hypothetical protein